MPAAGRTSASSVKAVLEALAGALDSSAYAITLQGGRRPRLTVTNRRAAMLTESVYAESGWYWWGWGEKLAPDDDVAQATEKIAAVLSDTPPT